MTPAGAPAATPVAGSSEEAKKWLTGKVPADSTGDFKIMSWEDEGEMRKFLLHIDRFFKTFYPGMKPEIEWGIPWDEYWTKLSTLMAAGTPPDLAWQHDSRGKVFPSKGWSVDLTDYIAASPPDGWPDDWWEASVRSMTYDGKVYGIPYDWATSGIYVNRKMMDPIMPYPASDDWTFDDLTNAAIAASGEVDGQKVWGVALALNPWHVWGFSKAFGGGFFDESHTQSMFNDPKTMEAFQWVWDLRWKHKAMPTPEDESAMGVTGEATFVSGRVAMRRGLNDVGFRYDEAIGDSFPWGVYAMPSGPGGRYAFTGNSGWFVPTGSRYPDMAYEMIRYCLSNPELLPTTGTLGSSFVGRKSFVDWGLPKGKLGEAIPNYKHVFVDLPSQNQAAFPWWPGYQEWEQLWLKWTDPIFVEGKPNVEEALLGLHEDTNNFLAGKA
jgi:multiple sugar transport system substrate-binding protein